MIIGMRGHDFGRMQPEALADAIRETGFAATQLAFSKAFPEPAEQYMTPESLRHIRSVFSGISLPVMGCYVSASDRDPSKLAEAKTKFKQALSASVLLGAGCVGSETTHFTFPEAEREAAYARLLDFTREVCAHAKQVGARVGIEPVAVHTLNTPELAARLLSDVNSPSLRIILDTANLVTPQTTAPEAQMEILERALACFGEKICVLHVKDGVFNSESKWENRPLGQGIMDWAHLLPRLRMHDDTLCALREGVFPGMAKEECAIMHRWLEG